MTWMLRLKILILGNPLIIGSTKFKMTNAGPKLRWTNYCSGTESMTIFLMDYDHWTGFLLKIDSNWMMQLWCSCASTALSQATLRISSSYVHLSTADKPDCQVPSIYLCAAYQLVSSFTYRGTKLWNYLSSHLKYLNCPKHFKHQFANFLLK